MDICNISYSLESILWNTNHPYHIAITTCNVVALGTFITSMMTGNLSQVDKLWSIIPAVYAWMYSAVDRRTFVMACLSSVWSIRLTYNFNRRGGYSFPLLWRGEEDYRWECIRSGVLGGYWKLLQNKFVMMLFNLLFISLYQNYLLLYIATPSLVAWTYAMESKHCPSKGSEDTSLNIIDGIAIFLFLSALIVETIADNQQYNFQQRKAEWKSSMENGSGGGFANAVKSLSSRTSLKEYTDGFCQSGLFSIVRKPAYAGEQMIWISFYLFSVAAVHEHQKKRYYINCSIGGCILLCLLFQGSGWLTEQISISKYPEYRSYQKRVPLYVPKISSLLYALIGRDDGKGKLD